MAVESASPFDELFVDLFARWRSRRAHRVEGSANLNHDLLGRHISAVEIDRQMIKADLFQPALHDLKGSPLLGNEQDSFAGRGEGRDQIDDGLTLAGPRRPVDHATLTADYGPNRALLTGIRIEDCELIIGRNPIEFARVKILLRGAHDCPSIGIPRDGSYDVVRAELICSLLQVLHHGHLLEGEIAQNCGRFHIKAWNITCPLQ